MPLVCLAVLPYVGSAQLPLAPDTLNSAQMQAHLQYQWKLLLTTSILAARQRGQSATELGSAMGHFYAERWGRNLHPQEFGRAIELRFRRLGFRTEVDEDSDSAFTFRWTGPDSASFAKTYGSWGITVSELHDWLDAENVIVCDEGGLNWTHRRQGIWRRARITRKPRGSRPPPQ
jgi:hypothetical protein